MLKYGLLKTYTKANKMDIDEIIKLYEEQIKLYLEANLHQKATNCIRANVLNHFDKHYIIEYKEEKIGYIYEHYSDKGTKIISPLLYPDYRIDEIKRTLVHNANCCARENKPVYVYIYNGDKEQIELYKRSEFSVYSQTKYFTVLRFVFYNMWWM